MTNKPISSLEVRTQDLTGADLMLISQFTAAGWKSAQVTLEDFFIEMFQPGSSAGQIIVNMQSEINQLDSRMDMHEHPELNTADPNYDPHFGFFLRLVTKVASNSGLVGDGRAAAPLALDYTYLNTVYARSSTIVDNLTSTSATTPLSANMGRALNVAKTNISETRQNFGENIVSLIATTGYNFNNALPGDYVYLNKQTATAANSPPFEYSTTFTECSINTSGQLFQIARDYQTGQIAVRALQNSTWSAWRKQLMEGDVGAGTTVGNANTLSTPRNINGVGFDGSADITIFAEKKFIGTIATDAEENAATTPGFYSYTSGNTVTGLAALGVGGYVDVRVIGSLVHQIRHTRSEVVYAEDVVGSRSAQRSKLGAAAWSTWLPVGLRGLAASTTGYGVTKLNNTLTSAVVDEALTAAQGKVLKDTKVDITAIRNAFGNRPIDLIVPAGYNFNNIMPGEFVFYDGGANITNPPPFAYCSVYCERSYSGVGERTVTARDYFTGRIATRGRNNNSWSTWQTHLVAVDVANAITAHKAETDPHPQYITAAQLEASTVGGLTEHILDLSGSGFDPNTYYPVTINITNYGRCNFEIDSPLYFSTAPWSTHGSGTISVIAKWSEYPSVWGSNNIDRTIDVAGFVWCVNSPVISITQLMNSSTVVFFLRGKTKYRVRMTKTLVPVIRTASYSINGQTIEPKVFDNTAPISIMNDKIGQSHLTDPDPHPQYAKQTWVNDTYFPKSGGTITGYTNINSAFGVMGTTDLKTTNVNGDLTCANTVRGYSLQSVNPYTGAALNIHSWSSDLVEYSTYNGNPIYSKVLHYFKGGPILSEDGFSNLVMFNNDGYSGNMTNTQGQVIGNFTGSYIIINQRIQSPGYEQGYERWCQMIINVQFNSLPGEVSSLMYFPISFKRPPTITTARRLFDKDSAGTPYDGDGGALLQYVGTQYCYISLQYFNSNTVGSVRGYTLNIAGWVPA